MAQYTMSFSMCMPRTSMPELLPSESKHRSKPMTVLTTKDKIFGYGPETFRVLMENYYLGELGNVIFDNAHNEYLHYLITIGLFGMLS